MSRVAIIGYGNVGYHLANRLSIRHEVSIFSRNPKEKNIHILDEFLPDDFEFIILSVSDSAIKQVSNSFSVSDAVVIHTSGTCPLSDIKNHPKRGVVYPLQTFSKNQKIDFSLFPIFVEGNGETERKVFTFVRSFSNDVKLLKSSDRAMLHLAAVFACNFSNHMYHIAEKYLLNLNMEFRDIRSLVEMTLQKALELNPSQSQTGPAMRDNEHTINTHIEMIKEENLKVMYRLISNSIRQYK